MRNFIISEPFSGLMDIIEGLEGESTDGSFKMEYGMWHTFKIKYCYIIVCDEPILEMKLYLDKELTLWRVGAPSSVRRYFRENLKQMIKDLV